MMVRISLAGSQALGRSSTPSGSGVDVGRRVVRLEAAPGENPGEAALVGWLLAGDRFVVVHGAHGRGNVTATYAWYLLG